MMQTNGLSHLIVAIAILVVVCLLHLNDWFLSDDYVLIGRISQSGIYTSWGGDAGGFLRPLTVLSLWLDHSVWGLTPAGYHITGFLLYLATVAITFLLALELCQVFGVARPRETALIAGALFAVLPSHAEPLLWISARADLLAAFLGVASCVAFVRMCRSGKVIYGTCALLLFALGLAAKESLVSLPVIWLLIAARPHADGLGSTRRRRGVFLVLGLGVFSGYLILRKAALGTFVGGLGTDRHLGISLVGLTEKLLRYFVRVVAPPLDQPELAGLSLLVLLAAAAVVGMGLFRNRGSSASVRLLLMGGLLFLAALLPVMALRIGVMDTQSERYLFLPGVFACIGIAAALREACSAGRAFSWLPMVVVLVFGAGLFCSGLRYGRAQALSERLSERLAELDPAESIVTNLPDNYRGAYVFRNGVEEAAAVFRGGNRAPEILMTHGMEDEGGGYRAEIVGDSVHVVLPDSAASFARRPETVYYYFDGRCIAEAIEP